MAKGAPWFKFTPTEWLTGDINFEEFEMQGLFINICAVYWQKGCDMTLEELEKRYGKANGLKSLLGRFISVSENKIKINFLDELWTEKTEISEKNSKNGSKGGRPKALSIKGATPRKANAKPNESQTKAKKSHKEKEKEKEKEYIYPTLDEFKKYCEEQGYGGVAERAFNGYSAANWHDVNGKRILNWKQKLQNGWFREENKTKSQTVNLNKAHV